MVQRIVRRRHRLVGAAWLLAATCGTPRPARAQPRVPPSEPQPPPRISVTEGQLLATLNQAGVGNHWVITLQHFSTWRYGSNFFFVDASAPPGMQFFRDGLGLYLEYAPVVSLGRLLHRSLRVGPVTDVGATLQINGGQTPANFEIPRVFLEGVDIAWAVPGIPVFSTQLLARQERTYRSSWQFTWIYAAPFMVGRSRWLVQGFMDVWRREQDGQPSSTVLLAQPQLLLHLAGGGNDSELQIGAELEPSHDYPLRAVHEGWGFAVSPMLRWVF